MSTFKRFVDIAKAEVGALREKVSEKVSGVSDRVSTGGSRKLADFSDDELSLEIERRQLAKKVRDEQDARKAADVARSGAREGAEAKESRGRKSAPPREAPPRRAPPAGAARGRPIVSKTIEQYFANLEVEPGADLETIKRAYRRLMRKYHPDKHANDPTKYKAATELAQSLTKAYMELKKHLERQ